MFVSQTLGYLKYLLLTLKWPPGVKYDPSLRFFLITFLVYLTMQPTLVTLSRQVFSRLA